MIHTMLLNIQILQTNLDSLGRDRLLYVCSSSVDSHRSQQITRIRRRVGKLGVTVTGVTSCDVRCVSIQENITQYPTSTSTNATERILSRRQPNAKHYVVASIQH